MARNRRIAGWTGVLLLAGTAGAAAQPMPVHDWTGLYGGVHGGVGRGDASYDFLPEFGWFDGLFATHAGGSFRQDFGSGGVFGFHVGANRQFGSWVVGLEGAYAHTRFHASSADPMDIGGMPPPTYEAGLDWIASVTPRLGYALGDWLVYGKGGLAAGRVDSLLTSPGNGIADTITYQEQGIHVGWTVGAGAEWALTPNWILGVEYNHYDLGSEQFGGVMRRNGNPDEAGQHTLALRADTVTARVSYLWSPDRMPPNAAPATYDPPRGWAGFYIGVHGGYGWASADNRHSGATAFFPFAPDPPQAASFDQSLGGALAGGHVGLNYQAGQWVFGLEGALTWSGLKGSSNGVFAALGADPAASYETKLDWLATLTPRIGWDFGHWLPYVKAGLAMGQVASSMSTPTTFGMFSPGPHSFSETNDHLGWTAGAGVEVRLPHGWIAGLEYNYVDLGSEHFGGLASNGLGLPNERGEYDVALTMQSVLARLSYRP